MSLPARFDWYVKQFCDFETSYVWSQRLYNGALQAVDLSTGWTATIMVRVNPTDVSPLLTISTTPSASGSISFSTPSGGTVENEFDILITHVAMSGAAFTPNLKAYYDAVFTDPTGLVVPVISGAFIVVQNVVH